MSIAKFVIAAASIMMLVPHAGAQSAPSSVAAPITPPPVAAAPPAAVAMPATSLTSATAAEIQAISEHNTILAARLGQLELKAKIAAKQKELSTLDGGSYSPLGSSAGMPSVVSVAGLKGNLEAVLAFPGNVLQRVKAGDVIGDRKIASISLNEVVLADLKGKGQQRLAFGTTAVMRDVSQASSSNPGIPMGQFPPLPAPQR